MFLGDTVAVFKIAMATCKLGTSFEPQVWSGLLACPIQNIKRTLYGSNSETAKKNIIWLVVGPPSEKYESQLAWLEFPNIWENRKCSIIFRIWTILKYCFESSRHTFLGEHEWAGISGWYKCFFFQGLNNKLSRFLSQCLPCKWDIL